MDYSSKRESVLMNGTSSCQESIDLKECCGLIMAMYVKVTLATKQHNLTQNFTTRCILLRFLTDLMRMQFTC